MQDLKPMAWPRPVPLLWWTADYADIRERVRKTGRLDTEQMWLDESGDSMQAFMRRTGIPDFGMDWRGIDDRNHTRQVRIRARLAEQARVAHEQWEAERRRRQQEKQAQSDREWEQAQQTKQERDRQAQHYREIQEARAWWSQHVDQRYAGQTYRNVNIRRTGMIDGVTLYEGRAYWLPKSIAERLT